MLSSLFQEIAFKAELDRHFDPECEYQARIICGEDSITRAKVVEKLRNMIYERSECHPPRMDDAFLLRFLRARYFVPARAHRLMVRYCKFREQNPHLWRDVYWYGLTRIGNIVEGVLFDRPDVGRLMICNLGKWDPEIFPLEDLIRSCLMLLEVGIMQPKIQVLGGTVILDCEGIGMKQARQLTPSVATQFLNVMGFTVPFNMRSVHVVNCSPWYEKLFYVFKRMAPSADMWEKVHFHGFNYNSLQRHIDPECLPKRYGGYRDTVSMDEWMMKIKKYKNKQFDEDMRTLGYAVDE